MPVCQAMQKDNETVLASLLQKFLIEKRAQGYRTELRWTDTGRKLFPFNIFWPETHIFWKQGEEMVESKERGHQKTKFNGSSWDEIPRS